jgi:glycosyltransferase involved in cell wall biosynthesis
MAAGPLRVLLVTEGPPSQLSGGYRYHRQMAQLAAKSGAVLSFHSVPVLPFPLAILSSHSRLANIPDTDVVVVDSIASAYLAPWLSRLSRRRPMVAMVHQLPGGMDHGPLRSLLQTWLDRMALRRSSTIMVASAWLADQLRLAGLPPIIVVPPGRDLPVIQQPPPDLRGGRSAALLCVANWLPRKGIDVLLEAVARLPDRVSVHLVGRTDVDASYSRKLRRRLSQADLVERVVIHGPQPAEQVAGFYRGADVFALPSFVEPYGTVYGEAMAAGLPVVGWRRGNLPYLASDGREGFLVEPGDLAGLTAALHRLIEDPTLRHNMGSAARERAQSFPSWEESAGRFFSTLAESATKSHGGKTRAAGK